MTKAGVLGIGLQAEADFGHKHFLELLSVFTSPPLLSVRHGRNEIGLVPDESLLARPPGAGAGGAAVLTLAGRSWLVLHVDWPRRIVQVEPTDAPGVARWTGGGQPLGAHVARGIRSVLCGADPVGVEISSRATERLASARTDQWWANEDATTVVRDDAGKTIWWTFAGWKANLWLGAVAAQAGCRTTVNQIDDLTISLDPDADVAKLRAALGGSRRRPTRPRAVDHQRGHRRTQVLRVPSTTACRRARCARASRIRPQWRSCAVSTCARQRLLAEPVGDDTMDST